MSCLVPSFTWAGVGSAVERSTHETFDGVAEAWFISRLSHVTHMSWAKFAIEGLQQGKTVQIRPRGHSMRGKVNDGDLVTLEPCDPATLQPDDIVLVKVRGRDYLHLVKAVNGGRFQIGNNRGHINGWVGHNCIYGRATKIER